MSKYGVWMLETLIVKYCDIGGSSKGMRLFLQDTLPNLRASNTQLAVEEQVTRYRHPKLIALYRNGRSKPVCVKNLGPRDILDHVNWLRNSHGRGQEYHVVRSRHLSRNPTVQGQWTVSTFASQQEHTNAIRAAARERMTSY